MPSAPKSSAMENRNSGTVKIRPVISRRRWLAISLSRALASASSDAPPSSTASKPLFVTAARISAWLITVGIYFTRARSVATLTVASSTPSNFPSVFSNRRASLSSARRLITKSASPVAMPYPARSMRASRAGRPTMPGSNVTVARSDDRLTTAAWTPASFFRPRSTVATQLAQVIPVIGRVSCFVSDIIYL